MVVMPTKAVMPKIGSSINPVDTPIAAKMKENSLICAGDAGFEGGSFAVAHAGDNHHEDEGVPDQDEQRQHHGGTEMHADITKVHAHAQGHEEDGQKEIHQRMHAPPQVIAKLKLR